MSYSIGEEVLSSTPNMTMVDGIRCDTMEFTMFHIHAHHIHFALEMEVW
jgi:hypothetical protein